MSPPSIILTNVAGATTGYPGPSTVLREAINDLLDELEQVAPGGPYDEVSVELREEHDRLVLTAHSGRRMTWTEGAARFPYHLRGLGRPEMEELFWALCNGDTDSVRRHPWKSGSGEGG